MPYFRVKNSGPVVTTSTGVPKLINFLPGWNGTDNNILYADYWAGTRWALREDPDSRSFPNIRSRQPSSVAHPLNGTERIHAFVAREDNHMWDNWWNGTTWTWVDLGASPSRIVGDPHAITDLDGGVRKVHVFFVTEDGRLRVVWHDGVHYPWNWGDLGSPDAGLTGSSLGVTTHQLAGVQKVHIVADGRNGHVYSKRWDSGWSPWEDRGAPGTRPYVSTVTTLERGVRKVHVFSLGSDNRLFHTWRSDSTWNPGWEDLGSPTPAGVPNTLSTVAFVEGGLQKIHVFMAGADGHIHIKWWDGNQWNWEDRGTPGVSVSGPAAVTFYEGGINKIYVFTTGGDHLPYLLWWNWMTHEWAWHPFRTIR